MLDLAEAITNLQRLVRLPHVEEQHEGTQGAEHHHADLQRIALALPLFRDLLVEEVEVESHARVLVPQIFKGRAARDVQRDKFIRQCLAFFRRQRHFAGFERVPDFTGQAQLVAERLQDRLRAGEAARNKDAVNVLLVLAFEKSDRVADFGSQAGERTSANFSHAGIALLHHNPGSIRIERSVRRQSLGEGLAAVINAADENELSFAADKDRALQMSHIEQEEGVVCENFGIGEFESVKGADWRELENVGWDPRLGAGLGNLLNRWPQHSPHEVLRLGYTIVISTIMVAIRPVFPVPVLAFRHWSAI